jgi:uncharacterized protein YecT (DUF1311 family)
MIRSLCLAALLAAFSPALLAAQEEGEEFCPEGRTQLDYNICAADEAAEADSLLNDRYQQVLRKVGEDRVELLRAAQRAWIRFRDAECTFQASEMSGGSGERSLESLCVAHLSRERVEEFDRILAIDR